MILEFPSPPAPWYAIAVPPAHEFLAQHALDRHELETYVPTRKKKHWRGIEVDYPALPGYVFARKTEPEIIYGLLRPFGGLRWMWRILGDFMGPVEIPDSQIQMLRLMLARPKVEVMPITEIWKGGEEIEITAGPLKGSRGRVACVKGKVRLVVLIEMLGRAVSTELDAAAVKALPMELPKAA